MTRNRVSGRPQAAGKKGESSRSFVPRRTVSQPHSLPSATIDRALSVNGVPIYDPHCRECPRLAEFLEQGKREYPTYHSAPVGPFGDPNARLLIVGLAPGFHGANASGRPFTGDYAGILLYRTLHKFGFASAPESRSRDDDLELIDCRISN